MKKIFLIQRNDVFPVRGGTNPPAGVSACSRCNKSFTLIEVLVAVAIVGVLSGLALVSLGGAKTSARDGRRKADLEEVRTALEMRRSDCGSYPSGPLVSGQAIVGDTGCKPPSVIYMEKIPYDPRDLTASKEKYYYTGGGNAYYLCASLEVSGGTAPHCTGATNCGTDVSCNYEVKNP